MVNEYRTAMKSVRPVKPVSTKPIFPVLSPTYFPQGIFYTVSFREMVRVNYWHFFAIVMAAFENTFIGGYLKNLVYGATMSVYTELRPITDKLLNTEN
jgi:hypothetical protein